jgi:hypothetical protein
MSFKSLLLLLCAAACANDRQTADRIVLDTIPEPPIVDSNRPPVNVAQVLDSATAREFREMSVLIDAAMPEILRFPPDSFPEVPPNVRAELTRLGCLIPQTYVTSVPRRDNVIRGKFAAPNQEDWAALCSKADTSMVVVVWGGPRSCPSPIERNADRNWMQGIGDRKFGFSRAIGVATISEIDQHAEWYDGPPAPARDHDGLDHIFMGKASTTLFCHQGKWVRLQGAN